MHRSSYRRPGRGKAETVLPLVFPDGTRAVATYPRRLRLSRLGVQPDVTYYFRRNAGARFALTFVHGPAEPRASEFALRTNSWTILVPFRAGNVARRDLRARETKLGFPVVTAKGPLVLSSAYGEGGGAMLAFGDGIPASQMVSSLDPLIEVAPTKPCRLGVEISGGYGARCYGDVFVTVTGKPRFVRELLEGLRIDER
jgi:hypothetical protein